MNKSFIHLVLASLTLLSGSVLHAEGVVNAQGAGVREERHTPQKAERDPLHPREAQQAKGPDGVIKDQGPGEPSCEDPLSLPQDELEPLYLRAVQQGRQLDCILQELAFNVANNTALALKNRSEVIKNIRMMRDIIGEIKEKNIIILNVHVVGALIMITRRIAIEIDHGLRGGVACLRGVDLNDIDLPDFTGCDTDRLATGLAKNQALIEGLENSVNKIGLRWYNHLYRSFKGTVIEPARAAAVPAMCFSIVVAAGFCVWYYFGGENPKWLRDRVGWPAEMSPYYIMNDASVENPIVRQRLQDLAEHLIVEAEQRGSLSPEQIAAIVKQITRLAVQRPVGWLGKLEHEVYCLRSGQFVLGAAVMSAGLAITGVFATPVGAWFSRKGQALDNFLMGGAYSDRHVGDIINDTGLTFDDVVGQEEAKKYGRELCLYLQQPELYERTKSSPKTGILLYGPTRSGKSYFITALFGEIKKALGPAAAFKVWKVPLQMLLRQGIQEIIDIARRDAPCIILIEEIDLLGLQRVGNAERLSEFLTAMSSCLQDDVIDRPVIIIATTNRMENVDQALLTDGRFGKHLSFGYPNFSDRCEYISHELERNAFNLEQFDVEKLARETEGCSFERLALFIKHAFFMAKLYGTDITQDAFEQSIDGNVRGISCKGAALTDEQKKLVCAHLAGHTLACMLLNSRMVVSKVTIRDVASKIEEEHAWLQLVRKDERGMPRESVEHGRVFMTHGHDTPGIESRDERIKQCKICLSGYAAESIVLGSCGYGYHPGDRQEAFTIARAIASGGLDLSSAPNNVCEKYYSAAFGVVEECEREVAKLLAEHRQELDAIMDALMTKDTLGEDELRVLVHGQDDKVKRLDAGGVLARLLGDDITTSSQAAEEPGATPCMEGTTVANPAVIPASEHETTDVTLGAGDSTTAWAEVVPAVN